MKPSLSLDHLLTQIQLPEQDQSSLSFCNGTKASKVAKWAESLPTTRISRTSVILYEALPEIIRLNTNPNNKLAMLEHLRPYVQQCIKGLSQSVLNHSLSMPDEKLKAATIAQALQRHMSTGYMLVATQLFSHLEKQPNKNQEQNNLLLTLHRALTGIEQSLFYCARLYTPAHPKFWQELHALYLITEQLGISQQQLKDPLINRHPSSCQKIYIRTLLLASARTNQITQHEIEELHEALGIWGSYVQMARPENKQRHCIYFNISGRQGPSNKPPMNTPTDSLSRVLDLSSLIDGIKKHLDGVTASPLRIPPTINNNLLKHLINTWGIVRERDETRSKNVKKTISIAVGLTSIHYHLANRTLFNNFLLGIHSHTSHLNDESTYTSSKNIKQQREKFPTYDVQLQDISSGGFCFKWQGDIPRSVKAGEILGIYAQQDNNWTVGVIRWVRQARQGALLGVQVLSTRCEPCAVKLLQTSSGHDDYKPALLSDARVDNNLTRSVITTLSPLKEGKRVQCYQKQQSYFLVFDTQLFSTSTIQQLSYRVFEHSADNLNPVNPKRSTVNVS